MRSRFRFANRERREGKETSALEMVLAPPYTEKRDPVEWTLASPSPAPTKRGLPPFPPSISPLTKTPFGFILTVTEYVRAKIATRELCRRWAWWKHRGGVARVPPVPYVYGISEYQ